MNKIVWLQTESDCCETFFLFFDERRDNFVKLSIVSGEQPLAGHTAQHSCHYEMPDCARCSQHCSHFHQGPYKMSPPGKKMQVSGNKIRRDYDRKMLPQCWKCVLTTKMRSQFCIFHFSFSVCKLQGGEKKANCEKWKWFLFSHIAIFYLAVKTLKQNRLGYRMLCSRSMISSMPTASSANPDMPQCGINIVCCTILHTCICNAPVCRNPLLLPVV